MKRAASLAQVVTTLVGATTRNGGASGSCDRAYAIIASVWIVLPKPMSSASTPPSRCRQSPTSQPKPSRW